MQKNAVLSYIVVLIQFAAAGYIVLSGPLLSSSLMVQILQIAGIGLGLWAIYVMRIGNFNINPKSKIQNSKSK